MVERDEAAEIAELTTSGLFDSTWYAGQNPDLGRTDLQPAAHYVRHGWQEGRWPNPYFDPAWYLASYPDVASAAMDPLLHYARHGDLEGRKPMPFFEPNWYRASYELAADRPALRHFLARRDTGRFAPCVLLYAVPYLAAYRDDPARGIDPYRRYLDDQVAAQREVFPDVALVAQSGLLDASYYLVNGSDVHDAQLDPADHFCRHGWQEHRKPNIYFDTAWYLATNPSVGARGLNPLVHYYAEGERSGRRPVVYFDPGWYRMTFDVPPEQSALAHFLNHRRGQTTSPTPWFDVAWYVARHAESLGPNRDPFAHFLLAGTHEDVDPSPRFDAAAYRRRHLGRPSRGFRALMTAEEDNPLIHFLRSKYR